MVPEQRAGGMNRDRILDGIAIAALVAVLAFYVLMIAAGIVNNGGHW